MAESPTGRRRTFRVWWIGMAVFVGLNVWLLVWLIGAVGVAREAARRSQCRGRFCQLRLALLNYHDVHDSFPPAYVVGPDGTRWHSWRTLLLPFFEQQDIYQQYRFDEPWDGPNNQQLAQSTQIPWLQCASSPGHERSPFTNYVVVVGDGTYFPGAASVSIDADRDPENTILLVEVDGLNIHWMEPRDLELATMSFAINAADAPSISSSHGTGAHVMSASGGCGTATAYLTPGLTESHLRNRLVVTVDANEEKQDE